MLMSKISGKSPTNHITGTGGAGIPVPGNFDEENEDYDVVDDARMKDSNAKRIDSV